MKTEYTVVRSSSAYDLAITELSERVQALINEGWELAGGVCVTPQHMYQAMTRDVISASDRAPPYEPD